MPSELRGLRRPRLFWKNTDTATAKRFRALEKLKQRSKERDDDELGRRLGYGALGLFPAPHAKWSFLAAFPGKQVRKERRAAYRASRRAKPLDRRLTETGNAISEFGKMKRIVYVVGILAMIGATGCGGSESQYSTSESTARESAQHSAPTSSVSPACETARESLRLEASNPKGNPTYVREDKEFVQEECGASARARWARIQHEQTPEGEAEKAEEVEENAGQVQEEAAEVEKVIKQRQAERIANELEGR